MKTNLQNLLLKNVRCIVLLTAVCFSFSTTTVFAGPFTPGNIVVHRSYNGGAALNSAGAAVFLDEYTTSGVYVQTVALPSTAASSGNRAVCPSGSATSEGDLSLSPDGLYLSCVGYNATAGTAGVASSTNNGGGSDVNRVVARIDSSGNVDSTTVLIGSSGTPLFNANNIRSAIISGTKVYSAGGVAPFCGYSVFQSNTAVTVGATASARSVRIFGGNLYFVTSTTCSKITGLPTASAVPTAFTFSGTATSSAGAFAFLDVGNSGTLNTAYIVDGTTLRKYSVSGTTLTASGTTTLGTGSGVGLTTSMSGSTVTIYTTALSGGVSSIQKTIDASGAGGTLSASATTLTLTGNPVSANFAFRGIAFAPANIITSGTPSALSTTYGTASSSSSFSVSAVGLTANLIVTPPGSDFEVSTSSGSGFGSSVTLTPTTGTVASTTIYVRLAATAVLGSHLGNVSLASTGVPTQTVAIPSSTVSAKGLTITGVSGVSKTYDATTAATLSGTPAYVGLENGESFAVTGTAAALFNTAAAGTGKAITITGYTAPSTNYTVSQPAGVTADINQKTLTITANDLTKSFGTTITGGAGSTAFTSIGLVNSESIGSVTIAYGSGASAGDAPGIYLGSVTPSAAAGGTFTATNYSINYNSGSLTVSGAPSINASGTLTAVDTTYGSASASPTSFTVSGANLLGNISVNAPAGFEISTSSGSGYGPSLSLTPTSGTVAITTIYVRLAAGDTVSASPFSGNIVCSSTSATPVNVATAASSVAPKGLTITGLSGTSKTYDRTTTATLTGTPALSGVVSGDVSNVSLGGTPAANFSTAAAGTPKSITVTGYTITGSASSNYSLTQPTGLTGGIDPLALTVSGAAVTTRATNGTTNATITGTLAGVISPDAVTFIGTGTFASVGPGTGIAVTSTSTLGGADAGNYSLTQPTGLTGTITASTNANLTALTLSAGLLSPNFSGATTGYVSHQDHAMASITVTPTASDSSATITVNGGTVTSGSASPSLTLNEGPNTITIVVTATDTVTTKTYTINAFRPTTPLSTGAIAFTGFNAEGNDDIAFVALTTIPENSVIHFTDNEWNGSAIGSGGAFNDFGESEWVWIAPSGGLAAGSVVSINSIGTGTATTTAGSVEFVDSSNRGLSATAEAVYAFQGATHLPTVFLSEISSDTAASIANTGLTAGSTAIVLSSSSDGGRYKGARSGQTTFAAYLPLIGNVAANWDDVGNGDGTSYVPFSSTAFTTTSNDSTVSIDDVQVTEGDIGTKTLTFTVTRSNAAGAFTIQYDTADGTATMANNDYVASSGTITFAAGGSLTQAVAITINGDTTGEADETFFVNLSNIVNTLGTATTSDAQGVGTIINDDPIAPVITTQPASQAIATGATATLTVVVTGTPTPTLQWYAGASGDTSSPISGATSTSYTTPALLANASYWVRATNSGGSADSDTATITTSYTTPFGSGSLNVLRPNTAAWNPAGVTVNGTTFVNLGLQGVGRVAAGAKDPVTGESLGSVSDMQITAWKKNADGSYSGTLNTLPDRGYNNGAIFSNYATRINKFDFTFTPYTASSPTTAQNQIALTFTGSSRFTYDRSGTPTYSTGLLADATTTLFGVPVPATNISTTQSDGTVANRLTVDAEGLVLDKRAGKSGAGWVSDEYGPYIYHFNSAKQIDGQLQLPAALLPHKPVGTLSFVDTNLNGRRTNQGMEGIAQSPDGTRLFGLMQSATLQDSGSGNQGRYNTRLLVYDISSSDTPNDPIAQYVIQLPRINSAGNGGSPDRTGAQSCMLAINDHQILILSRDGNGRGSSGSPVFKSILLADLSTGTNIDGLYDTEGAGVAPGGVLAAGVTPLAWSEALNMIGKLGATTAELEKFGLNLNTAPGDINTICEKWEALSLVSANDPANPNDYFLFVGNDNDFLSGAGKYLDASGVLQSYDAGLENDTLVLAWRVRMTGSDNQMPFVANNIADQTATETTPFSFAFAANTFADPESQTLTYSATKSDDTALPAWLTFNPATRTFTGTPALADVGTLSVKVTATDNGTPALSVSSTFTITVSAAPPVLSFASSTYTVNEAAGSVTLTINRTGGAAPATVTLNTANGTGVAGTDYTAQSNVTVNFAANAMSATVSVPVINRSGIRASRTFTTTLSSPSAGAAVGSPATTTVTITEADTYGAMTGPSSSKTPYIQPLNSNWQVTSLLSVGDQVPVTANAGSTPLVSGKYEMAGIPDGVGAFDNGDGTFTMLVHHEHNSTQGVTRAHGSIGAFISEWIINKSTLQVVSGSDLIREVYGWDSVNQVSNAAPGTFTFNRFCSADLPAPTALYNATTGLGTQERVFLGGDESGGNGFAVASVASGANKGKSYILGKFNLTTNGSGLTGIGGWENLLANPYAQDKTIVIGNNDGGTGIMANAVAVYQGTKTNSGTEADKAGLTNGTLKFINVTGNATEVVNSTTRATNITSGTAFTLSATTSTTFSRPEDGAWDPSNPSKFYFVTTDRLDQVADGISSPQIGRTRLWRLNFTDITNPNLGGTIDLLIEGGGTLPVANDANMFDNITVTKDGKVVLCEDVGGAPHNGKVWFYDPATTSLTKVIKHDISRFGDVVGGTVTAATAPFTNDEETSGVIDVTHIFGGNAATGERTYLIVDQAHYNTGITTAQVEGGQLLLLKQAATFLGVASGDADSSSATLWAGSNKTTPSIPINVQVSPVSDFSSPTTVASSVPSAANGWTTKVRVTGLTAGTTYYYRFVDTTTGEVSSTGKIKTAPATSASYPLHFAFSGDNDGIMRPYPLASTIAAQNLDFYVNLGDVIYENASVSAGNNGASWLNSLSVTLSGSIPTPTAGTTWATQAQLAADYAKKYRENFLPVNIGGQNSLKDFYASQGNYTQFDNHELGNKQYINGGAPRGGPLGGPSGNDMSTGAGVDARVSTNDVNTSTSGDYMNKAPGFQTLIQTYLNWQPVNDTRAGGSGLISAPGDNRTDGTRQFYFGQQWGKNAIYINTDDRSYRDIRLKKSSDGSDDTTAPRANNVNRTMLGSTQLAWLKQQLLAAQSAGVPWKFVAVSDPIDQLGPIGGALSGTLTSVNSDGGKSWIGGYRAERNALLKFIADNHILNVVFLATDDHQNRINELTYSPTDTENQATYVKVPYCFSIVCGPLGATGPETITNHSFSNIKAIADSVYGAQNTAGIEPVGLMGYPGLHNLVREGDATAGTSPQAVDFYSPDTFNYTVFDVSTDGQTLTVSSKGINSFAQNAALEYDSINNPVRTVFSFQVDAAKTPIESWRQTYFGTTSNSGDAANTADPDGDGIVNLMEDALGINPNSGNGGEGPAALPKAVVNSAIHAELSDRLSLQFEVNDPVPSDITYLVEATNDLVHWDSVARKIGTGSWTWLGSGSSLVFIDPVGGGARVKVQVGDLVPMNASNPVRMMRLKVTNQ